MEVSRGANLVGMSMMPLDVCLRSLLIKKKIFEIYFRKVQIFLSKLKSLFFIFIQKIKNLENIFCDKKKFLKFF